MAHAQALTAFLNPTINAYRRLVPDSLAPTHANWGWDNRTAFVRVPPERGGATRVEVRVGDGSANPYLAEAAILFAGLHGVRENLPLGPPVGGDAYTLAEDDAGGTLPASLDDALDALEADDVLRDAMGPESSIRSLPEALRGRAPPHVGLAGRSTSTFITLGAADDRHDVSLEEIDSQATTPSSSGAPRVVSHPAPRGPVHFNPSPRPRLLRRPRRDIRAVHRNFIVYSSEVGGTSLEDWSRTRSRRASPCRYRPAAPHRARKLIARRFTSRAVMVWEEAVRTVCDRVLSQALPKGEFDFVEEISSEIPMQVFAEILGVPQEDRRLIVDMGDRILGNQDPEFVQPVEEEHRLLPFSSPVAQEMFEFGRKLVAARRKNPGNDIISLLISEDLTRGSSRLLRAARHAGNETRGIDHPRPARPTLVPGPARTPEKRPSLLPTASRRDAALGHRRPYFRRTTT